MCFIYWLGEIQCLVECEFVVVVCDFIYGIDYEFWLYEILLSFKVVEMCMKNVNQFFSWMIEMLEGNEFDELMMLIQVVICFMLCDMMECGESEEELDQVQLMMFYVLKGLEFLYVYMVGMEEGFLLY